MALAMAACLPVRPASAILTSQATVTANTVSAAASFPVCYRDAVTADNPVGYWKLDETSGTNATDSKGGRTGTYTNGVTLGQSGAPPDSINNKAASFDGVNDYVNVPYAAALNPATFTVEAWARPTVLTAGVWTEVAGTFDEVPPGGTYKGFWLGLTDTNWHWEVDGGANGYTYIEGPAPVLGSWTHLVGTFDGTTAKLYVNGTLAASKAATYTANANAPFSVGATYYRTTPRFDDFFNGRIDEVALYNTVLTAAQIRTHYNTGRCYKDEVLADTPVGYWRLGEASGTTAADGIRGRHGGYVGTPTLAATGALNLDSNTAATFNGSSQYVSVPYDSALNPGQVTLEAWAKPTGGAGTARTVVATQDTNKGYLLGIGTDNKWRFTVGTGGATTVVTGPTVTLSSWAHVVGTYNGTTATLYVNGISAGTASVTVSANTTRPLGIGATDAGGSWAGYFPGSLDEVALYGSALSQTRVQAHYLIGRSHRDVVLDRAPVSYWRLGESSGAAADSKGTNTGTYTNGPVLAQAGAVAGDADTSASFDGVDDYVDVPFSAALNPAQFTLEAWAKVTSGSGTWRLVASSWTYPSPSEHRGYWVGIDDQDRWSAHMGDGVVTEVSADGPTVTLNTWTHLAETYDGATLKLYVNGSLAASLATTTYTPNTSPTAFEIGAEYYTGARTSFFPGSIDEVAVYNTALTATQIQLHYDSGRQ